MPLIDELYGSMCFPNIDIKAGYHQTRVVNQDIHKTAFETHQGLYRPDLHSYCHHLTTKHQLYAK